jgi:hypothetical protein
LADTPLVRRFVISDIRVSVSAQPNFCSTVLEIGVDQHDISDDSKDMSGVAVL